MQTDACTALDWVAGLFFQSGRLLGLIMQAIATVIGADLGGFADEFGACFEESLFTFFHDVPPVFDWVNGLRGNPIRKCITAVQCVAEVGPADLRTYDAVFLDVELPGKDGFAFAQELRGAGCSADIVFVTNHPELSLKGYTVHAQDYIIKPVEQERIDAAMDYIARNCRLKERRSIVLQRGISQQDRYFLTEILYVEASNHSSIVYTYDKTQSYALTFAQMEKLLPAEDFKKCHRGYIVNLHAVKGLRRNSITLVDGREILVSTTYFQSVKDALIALRGGQ